MAVLTALRLTAIRHGCAEEVSVTYTKPVLNAAAQAVEDWLEANRPSLSTAINAATAPVILTPAQKQAVVKHWLAVKFAMGG